MTGASGCYGWGTKTAKQSTSKRRWTPAPTTIPSAKTPPTATTSWSTPIEGPEPVFTVGSGVTTGVDGIVRMSYKAGDPEQQYTEDLYAKADLPHHVILGMPSLMHSHAITVNPQFAHQKENDDFLLFETTPATKESKAKRAANAKQKREEREAAFQLRMAQQGQGK